MTSNRTERATSTKPGEQGAERKPRGWCAENGIEHSWRDGNVKCSYPPIYTRYCANCGQEQWLRPGEWSDV